MKCSVCGNSATKLNSQGINVCSKHSGSSVKSPLCPDCRLGMAVKKSKFGVFWGCVDFPMCHGIRRMS